MASLVLRDKSAPDARFLALLPLIEKGARDERNFVKKGVNWALRTVGKRSPGSMPPRWQARGAWPSRKSRRADGSEKMLCASWRARRSGGA